MKAEQTQLEDIAKPLTAEDAEEGGEPGEEKIARRVGARRWGPGRFREALDAASIEERIRRLSRTTYAPA